MPYQRVVPTSADLDYQIVVPRRTTSTFLNDLDEDERPRMDLIEEQIARMKRDANSLKDQMSGYKPKTVPSHKITPDEASKTDFLSNAFAFYYDDCVRNRLPKRKPGSTGVEVYPSALRPVDSILNDINTMSYYNKHQKILGAGPVGRLSCVSYAGKSPITKRTIRHPPNEDFASLNADILNMSLYPRNQHCALTSEYPARVRPPHAGASTWG
ncbi:unnamed protein product [Notodromas monacha]|uniref:Uncharacterized protein n=1 Tax=Notodromas monacha TaxID=399045 RepID=A0A7R9GIA1_9CRUS|nr:unnamed protein product [Notodromas monacha]CAG0923741.1 unnamed protein product [Notodromas monacha]